MKFDLCESCINRAYVNGAAEPCGTCIDGNNYDDDGIADPKGFDRAGEILNAWEVDAALDRMDATVVNMAATTAEISRNLEEYLCTYTPGPLAELVDPQARKNTPITTGVLDYFPDALAAVAQCSKAGNDQHNPGQPLHWDKSKSTDHADCIGRHLIQRGSYDTDGIRHSAKLAWRALALLQTEIEEERQHV